MSRYPVPTDRAELVRRLSLQERELGRKLAQLEERVQKFDTVDLPFYDNWVRLELGPRISDWEAILDQIRQRRILAWRIEQLVEKKGLHPREALYVATVFTNESEDSPQGENESSESERSEEAPRRPFGEAEIEARRRAKLEAKRAARKDAKEESKRDSREAAPARPDEPLSPLMLARRKGISLYRKLAFRLHPDSARADLPEARARTLWLEVQVAYESSDWDRLASIDAWMGLEGDDDGVQDRSLSRGERSLADRYERIRMLTRSAGKLEKKLAYLSLQPAWDFSAARSPERKRLRKHAAIRLEEQVEEAARALEVLEEYLESLGPPRPPKTGRSSL